MCICLWVYACECRAHGGQKRALYPLDLELQAVVSWEPNLDPV